MANPVPYITLQSPANAAVSVSTGTSIDFQFKTDNGPILNASTLNVFVNGTQAVLNGGFVNSYSGTLVLAGGNHQLNAHIVPPAALAVGTVVVEGSISDVSPVTGTDLYEFSTDSFSLLLELNPAEPITCPTDTIPDPYFSSGPSTVTTTKHLPTFTSPTISWPSQSIRPSDILRVTSGTNSEDFIVRSASGSTVTLWERPKLSSSTNPTEAHLYRREATSAPVRLVGNRAFRYPLLKLWGSHSMRYFGGWPSLTNFPVGFQQWPGSTKNTTNGGSFDDFLVKTEGLLTATPKFMNWSVGSNAVSGGSFDRYSLVLSAPEVPVQVGTRVISQFSISSMSVDAEFYLGLADVATSPTTDGNNRSGVTFRRTSAGFIRVTVYHGTSVTSLTTTLTYAAFIGKLWTCETEVVASGSTRFNLYDPTSNLVVPVVTLETDSGGAVNADRFTLTSIGNVQALAGAMATGSLYYVDVERKSGGPFSPFSFVGELGQSDAKLRPFDNLIPLVPSTTPGIKTLNGFCSMLASGPVSSTSQAIMVFDGEVPVTTIDSLTPDSSVPVSALEVPSPTTHRSSLVYKSLDGLGGVVFFASVTGAAGDLVTVRVVNPGTPSASFSLVFGSTAVVVNLATNPSSVATTTMQAITDAVEAAVGCPVIAVPTGVSSSLAPNLAVTSLRGGSEYKVSESSRFDRLELEFRATKTGLYYVVGSDTTPFERVGGASLSSDGTLTTQVSVFQPTDIGKTVTISDALNPSNEGAFPIRVVYNNPYPSSRVVLEGTFIAETDSFTWALSGTDVIVASGRYTEVGEPQAASWFTQDFQQLSDGERKFQILLCKQTLLTAHAIAPATSSAHGAGHIV